MYPQFFVIIARDYTHWQFTEQRKVTILAEFEKVHSKLLTIKVYYIDCF